MRLRLTLMCSAAMIGLAAQAHADPDPDARFLRGLNNAGISYQNAPDAMSTGRRVCELMDQGAPEADVINALTQQNSGFSNDAATKFTKAAEAVYCPVHLGWAPTPAQPWSPPIDFPWFPLPAAL